MSLPRPWPDERSSSVVDSFLRVCSEATALLRDSVLLVGAEARGRVSELGPALLLLGGAAGTLMVSLMAAGAASVAALVTVMPLWGAALVVALVALTLAAGLGALALNRVRRIARPPQHTMNALEEGMEWLRLRSNT